jgi:cell division protein FtsL
VASYEGYILVIFGIAIFFQQFIMYIMYVRIKQLLRELDTIEGKIKINDTELENLIQRVEEFKNINYGDEWQKSS